MNFLCAVLTILVKQGLTRIIESRDPKVDPLTLDNVLSQIVENSMDDMRFRLRQAIYTMALKKVPRFLQSDNGALDNYEERLLDHFIAQISGSFVKGSPPYARDHRSEGRTVETRELIRLKEPIADDDLQESHKMSIALETYTIEPVKETNGKLITADNLRMYDSPPAAPSETSTVKPRLFLFRLPLWQLLLGIIPSVIFLLLIALTLIVWFRSRSRRSAFFKRRQEPFMISGVHTLPDFTNTPQSFLERLNRQQQGTVVRERDHCEVWTRAPTANTSLESLPRV